MSLKRKTDKKDTVFDISADIEEREVLSRSLDKLREQMAVDLDQPGKPKQMGGKTNPRLTLGKKGESVDPFMYLKVDNALRKMSLALKTGVASAEIDMAPNEITRERGDAPAAVRIDNNMRSILSGLEGPNGIIKRQKPLLGGPPINTGPVTGRSRYTTEFVFDMTALEDNLKSGKKLEQLLQEGQVIPEYGDTWLPPIERGLLRGSKKAMMNSLILVAVKDQSELAIESESPEKTIIVDGGKWKKFVEGKLPIGGVKGVHLNFMREERNKTKPKSIGELVGLATVLATAKEFGLIGPRLAGIPVYMTLEDPKDGEDKRYNIYLVAGYSPGGRRSSVAQQAAFEEEGIDLVL